MSERLTEACDILYSQAQTEWLEARGFSPKSYTLRRRECIRYAATDARRNLARKKRSWRYGFEILTQEWIAKHKGVIYATPNEKTF